MNRTILIKSKIIVPMAALFALSALWMSGVQAHEELSETPKATLTAAVMETEIPQEASDLGDARELLAEVKEEVNCLALNIYFEARGEPESGQRAVAHVVMNRVAHKRYPNTVCAVVQQGGEERLHRCQFSWWCDGQSDKPGNSKAWNRALIIAKDIYLGKLKDTTKGALWYHSTYVTPYWSKVFLKGDRIGQHIFYLENRQPQG